MHLPFKAICVIVALVLFAIASFPWEPYRVRFIAGGLFFGTLSLLL